MSLTANLSHVGSAAFSLLNTNFSAYKSRLWDLTDGKVIGDLQYTPLDFWSLKDDADGGMGNRLPSGHSDWFAQGLGELVGKTTQFCDLMSLDSPDGYFLEEIRKGLSTIAQRADSSSSERVIVRMMFGDFNPLTPTNVTKILHRLVDGVITDQDNVELWVGAWRSAISWNHAKLIAVDGRYLHTGGHNLWSSDYLEEAPVHDLSFELEGDVANGAHYYANEQWDHVQQTEGVVNATDIIQFLPEGWTELIQSLQEDESLPEKDVVDGLLNRLPSLANSFVANYPQDSSDFPPNYDRNNMMTEQGSVSSDTVPMISFGKLGTILADEPSEDAFVAVFDSSKTSIRLAIQDVGPRKICRDQPTPLPGFAWPTKHLSAFGRALARGVDIEMILSNLGAFEQGGYSNGWSCNDVAAHILQTIPLQYPEFYNNDRKDDGINKTLLTEVAMQHLRIGFLRDQFGNNKYSSNGNELPLHTKHFIVDDIAAYIGSENIYSFDIAEWGILVDDSSATKKMMDQLWYPMYNHSYTGDDCDLPFVVENLLDDVVSETGTSTSTVQDDLASIGACYGIENVTLPMIASLLLELEPGHDGQVTRSNETQSPSSAPSSSPIMTGSPSSPYSAASLENRHTVRMLTTAALFFFFVFV